MRHIDLTDIYNDLEIRHLRYLAFNNEDSSLELTLALNLYYPYRDLTEEELLDFSSQVKLNFNPSVWDFEKFKKFYLDFINLED